MLRDVECTDDVHLLSDLCAFLLLLILRVDGVLFLLYELCLEVG